MNQEREQKMNEVLNSLDGCTRATAPDFFYTRLKARMEREAEPVVRAPWMLRPSLAFAGMAIILLINIVAVFNRPAGTEESAAADTDTFQSLATEYRLNEGNGAISVYNLNQDK